METNTQESVRLHEFKSEACSDLHSRNAHTAQNSSLRFTPLQYISSVQVETFKPCIYVYKLERIFVNIL
jgi:hypothetical protein